jgi:hypothetical protein
MPRAISIAPYQGSLLSQSCIVLVLCSRNRQRRLLRQAPRRGAGRRRAAGFFAGHSNVLHRELDQIGVAGLLFFAVRDLDRLGEV